MRGRFAARTLASPAQDLLQRALAQMRQALSQRPIALAACARVRRGRVGLVAIEQIENAKQIVRQDGN